MARDRWEERLAARCIATELGVEVRGARRRIRAEHVRPEHPVHGSPPGAVEVTTAADPDSIALGRFVYDGEQWIEPDLVGGWGAALEPTAKWKDMRAKLPGLLAAMEAEGIRGVVHLFQSEGTDYQGAIYLTIDQGSDRTGGAVPTEGRPLLEWLAEWMVRPFIIPCAS